MSLLGKILSVLIAIMSIVFMTLAMTVYSSHKNWYTTSHDLQQQVAELNVQLDQSRDERDRLESRLTAEVESAEQQVRRLEQERERLALQNTGMQQELDQLKQESRNNTAAVAATQQNNDRLTQEVTQLRQGIRENEQARDADFQTTLAATEQRNQTQGELEILQQHNQELSASVGRMAKLLRANGIDPGTDPDFVMEPTDGIVSAISRRGSTHLIEVTIGSDDGLRAGHTLEVFRGNRYLGRAEIIETSPDRAIGKLDRRFLQGQIQEGDRVATRLKLS